MINKNKIIKNSIRMTMEGVEALDRELKTELIVYNGMLGLRKIMDYVDYLERFGGTAPYDC